MTKRTSLEIRAKALMVLDETGFQPAMLAMVFDELCPKEIPSFKHGTSDVMGLTTELAKSNLVVFARKEVRAQTGLPYKVTEEAVKIAEAIAWGFDPGTLYTLYGQLVQYCDELSHNVISRPQRKIYSAATKFFTKKAERIHPLVQ